MKSLLFFWILTAVCIFDLGAAISKTCYNCRYSYNTGCDLQLVDDEAGLTTVDCENDCYTSVEQSDGSSTYEIIRGCNVSPVCTDTSYSVGDVTTIIKCCSDDNCNYDVSQEIFQCYSCNGIHDDNSPDSSTCRETGYVRSTYGDFGTAYCNKFCEKRIRIEDGVKTITRSCQDTCAQSSAGTGVSTDIYCCQGDLCNSATHFNVSVIEIVAISFCSIIAILALSCQV